MRALTGEGRKSVRHSGYSYIDYNDMEAVQTPVLQQSRYRNGRILKGYGPCLLKQFLSHVVETAAPGEELMGRALGDKPFSVVAGGLQRLHTLVDAVRVLF